MELKLENKILYYGEEMKEYLINILDDTGYYYMIDENSKTINVFSRVIRPEDCTIPKDLVYDYRKIDEILGMMIYSPVLNEHCFKIYPQLSDKSHSWTEDLTFNEKVDLIIKIINRASIEYTKEFNNGKNDNLSKETNKIKDYQVMNSKLREQIRSTHKNINDLMYLIKHSPLFKKYYYSICPDYYNDEIFSLSCKEKIDLIIEIINLVSINEKDVDGIFIDDILKVISKYYDIKKKP